MKMKDVIAKRRKALRTALSTLPPTFEMPAEPDKDESRVRRVIIEAERTMIFRSRSSRTTLWCPRCAADVEMLSVEAAARHLATTELQIHQLIEFGTLHLGGDATGRLFVCLNSCQNPER
jgi:hypothetical protein